MEGMRKVALMLYSLLRLYLLPGQMPPELHPCPEPDAVLSSVSADIYPPRAGCLSTAE